MDCIECISPEGLSLGDLVIAMPPEPLATFLGNAGYLPTGVPLLKRILALSGHTVCREGLVISVDEIEMGTALERDRGGRLLRSGKVAGDLGMQGECQLFCVRDFRDIAS